MRRKDPNQLTFDLSQSKSERKADGASTQGQEQNVRSFREAKQKKIKAEIDQHVRAILTLVTHYK
jgi:hypothetical protein